ncbi:MAG TPA: imelysin family protein [Myxococcota bacterium]|nr:imelysin family protein [Myxococcota bacterium]
MRLPICISVAGALNLAACGQTERTLTPEGEEARRAVLASTVSNVIVPTYERFAEKAAALETALVAHAEAEATSDDAADTTAARTAWAEAILAWQEAELFILGPAAAMAQAGGAGLRDKIYSWPITNPCRVDQETVRGAWADASTLGAVAANVRGLAAVEWLLHAPATNACPPQAAINTDGTWNALSAEELRRKRADHAKALAGRLKLDANALRDAWQPSSGNFAKELAEAGLTPTYRSAQEGLNTVSDAMFYLDKEVKDMKLAIPLALRDCAETVCPDKTENPTSRRSKEHLIANTRAFLHVFHGGPDATTGTGFDDLLVAVGANSLADTIVTRVNEAIAALEAIEGPLEEAVVSDKAKVQAAYDKLRTVTDLLKTELLSVLDLELPERAEGDND